MKLFFQHFFLSHLSSFVSYQAENRIGPDFQTGFQTGFHTGFSDQIFRPDFGPDILGRIFRTDFGPDIRDRIFRTRFQISDRISDQMSVWIFGPDFRT